MNPNELHARYREDFQFLFVFSCVIIIAVLSLSLIVWSWQRDDSERLKRLEKLNGIEHFQEPCGCCPPLGVSKAGGAW
jgi:hypothetical protein